MADKGVQAFILIEILHRQESSCHAFMSAAEADTGQNIPYQLICLYLFTDTPGGKLDTVYPRRIGNHNIDPGFVSALSITRW